MYFVEQNRKTAAQHNPGMLKYYVRKCECHKIAQIQFAFITMNLKQEEYNKRARPLGTSQKIRFQIS
jgi:hypothetical protein